MDTQAWNLGLKASYECYPIFKAIRNFQTTVQYTPIDNNSIFSATT